MTKNNKEHKIERIRISLVDDLSHKQLWVMKFTRISLFITAISIMTLVMAGVFALFAYTPLKSLIPGYPDSREKRAAIQNAIRVDSLENVILRWEFYSENLRRVMNGEDPLKLDSLIKKQESDTSGLKDRGLLQVRDSLLRKTVGETEKFGLTSNERDLPIEGIHFFTPLKGVVSQGYDIALHPYIDITAPANSVVMAVLGGTVIGAGWSDETGYAMYIQHSNDMVSVYKHNQKLLKGQGDKVSAGAPIALVGNTGSITTGDHLHFELWHKGKAVDPTKYINF